MALVSFNVGVELGQLGFIALILGLERSFRILEVRWPRWAQLLPGYTVGSLGAFWTVQRVALLFGGAPGFDKAHWPNMADRAWGEELCTYYGAKPYWT